MKTLLLSALLFLGAPMDAAVSKTAKPALKTATFAGGCFWCMTPPYEQIEGVTEVLAGYTGGTGKNPTYEDYIDKGHTEAVQVKYDPSKVSYEKLLEAFWMNINPTDPDGQFADRGPGYYAGIYFHDEAQKAAAEKSKQELDKSGRFDKPVLTPIIKYLNFTAAEDYHQGYHRKNAMHYKLYKMGSGRQGFLEKVWADKKK